MPGIVSDLKRRAPVCWIFFWLIFFVPVWVLLGYVLHDPTLTGIQTGFHTAYRFFATYLLLYLPLLLAALIGFVVYRIRARLFVPEDERAPVRPLTITTRLLLFALSLFFLTTALLSMSRSVDRVVDGGVYAYPESERELKDTILVAATKAAITNDFDALIQQSLIDGDFERARAYVEAAEMFNRPI